MMTKEIIKMMTLTPDGLVCPVVVFDALYLGVAHHTAQWEGPGRNGLVIRITTFTIHIPEFKV